MMTIGEAMSMLGKLQEDCTGPVRVALSGGALLVNDKQGQVAILEVEDVQTTSGMSQRWSYRP